MYSNTFKVMLTCALRAQVKRLKKELINKCISCKDKI